MSFVADVVRARRPPFDPKFVVAEFAMLLKDYRVTKVTGDRYAAEWPVAEFAEHGVTYEAAERSKSELYLEALPLFARGAVSIPDYAPLIRELRLLERQTHRGGRDTVDHPKRGSDDLANALCGAAVLATEYQFDPCYGCDPAPVPDRDPRRYFRLPEPGYHPLVHAVLGRRYW